MGVKKYCLDLEKIRRKMYDVEKKNISKSDISDALGVTPHTVRRWEDELPVVIVALNKLALATGCKIDEFIKEA